MKFTKKIIPVLFLLAGVSCSVHGQIDESEERVPEIRTVDVDEFERLSQLEDAQVVDVRTDEEVAEGVIPGAEHMDITTREEFKKQVNQLDRTKPVLVYCRSGRRSTEAAKYLTEQGFQEVYNLDGGMLKWTEMGKPIQEL